MNNQVLYFGYGSNMYIQRLRDRVTSAHKISNGSLLQHTLRLNKLSAKDGSTKGNIELSNDDSFVLGVIFTINSDQIRILDAFEGVGYGYSKVNVTVINENNEEVQCITYIADVTAIRNNILPYDWYINFFIQGALQNNFPQDYINFLRQFQFTTDTDIARQTEARRIIALPL
jgi:gamma-glutamylcyclotransferase (GGCT)/AIG2-like uncharacterized protein YtfP